METQITAKDAIAMAKAICLQAQLGTLSYDEAKRQVTPLLDIANKRGRELARKYKMTYKPITFTGVLR